MKIITLIILANFLFFNTIQAQVYFYPSSYTLPATTFSACDSISMQLQGNFTDGCGYFPIAASSTVVQGGNVYCHVKARNLGCDSGWFCTMALVPVNTMIKFPPTNSVLSSGSLFLVIDNMCMSTITSDTFIVSSIHTNALSAINSLTASTPSSVSIGTPIAYQLNTNVPTHFTCNWYRNSILSYSAVDVITWNTTLLSNADTVLVEVINDSICVLPSTQKSNLVVVKVTPNSATMIGIEMPFVRLVYAQQIVTIHELQNEDKIRVYDIAGKCLFIKNVHATSSFQLEMFNWQTGLFIIEVQRGNKKLVQKIANF